jgi:hypothetical protein
MSFLSWVKGSLNRPDINASTVVTPGQPVFWDKRLPTYDADGNIICMTYYQDNVAVYKIDSPISNGLWQGDFITKL